MARHLFGESCKICRRDFSISRDNCQYRGEGNSSLVVQLKTEGKVIRILKCDTEKEKSINRDDFSRKVELQINYAKHLMKPLFGDLILDPVLICLSADEIQTLNLHVENLRPSARKHRKVREEPSYATLLQDFCIIPDNLRKYKTIGPVLGIEIKPKQGFLAIDDLIIEKQPRISVCKFCLKQSYKLIEGGIKSLSGYCPLDLFSGCPSRMKRAISELLKTPQNNLRIFCNQELVYSEEKKSYLEDALCPFFGKNDLTSSESCFQSLILQALTKASPNRNIRVNLPRKNKSEYCDNLQRLLCSTDGECPHSLVNGSVLDHILRVQQLSNVDVNHIYPYWKEMSNRLLVFKPNNSLNSQTSSQSYSVFEEFCQSDVPEFLGTPNRQAGESSLDYKKRKVWEFLVTSTAKDCSIILVIQKLIEVCNVPSHHVIYDERGDAYLFSVALIDMDPKPLGNMVERACQSKTMLQAYMTVNGAC